MNSKNKNNRKIFIVTLLLCALCSACHVGPDYRPVSMNVPAEWPSAEMEGDSALQSAEADRLARWWTTLDDPALSDLVKRALAGNRDIKIALTRIRQARAVLGEAGKQLHPSVTGSATYRRTQSGMPTADDPDPSAFSIGSDYYNAGFDASWEIDLFGKRHRNIEAAAAELESSGEGYHSILISMISETVSSYVRLRTLQKQLEIVNRNLEIQENVLSILEDKAAAGLIGSLQVQQSRYNIENTRARIPGYRVSIEETMNSLAILLGEMPGELHDELLSPAPIPVPEVEIVIGIPSDILRRRPDIRRAERALAAQTARVGAATADLYPSLRLTGSLGLTASSLDNFFSDENAVLNISPFISIPLFNRNRIRDQIEIQNAIQERTFIEYETTVVNAIKEVRDAIMAYGEEQKRYRMLEKGATAAKLALEIADERFSSGLVDFLDVLDAQRALLSFEESRASSSGTITLGLIRLYKALGGGWEQEQ
ncbi:MAG: efflux transporter outer membrane subunit [Deltaproteobacteria bacterium]|nr:efflux transporter outer membrane subunit [Deltaproteobacteria bacterium]